MTFPHSSLDRILPVLVLSAIFLGGCAGGLSIFSGPLTVRFEGASDMNDGNAARVRLYELSGDSNFRNTPLSTFWRSDEEALGSELVSSPREVLLYPNESTLVEFEVTEGTQFIGVAADLRAPDREAWRSIHAVEEVEDNEMTVRVGADRVSVRFE